MVIACKCIFFGISIDMFYNTAGMHAAATVWMAYIRPGVLSLISPREGYESSMQPTMQYFGIPWFISYAGILVFCHHLVLFYIEIFRFSEFFSTLSRVIISSIFTLLLVVVTQYLFYRNKDKK